MRTLSKDVKKNNMELKNKAIKASKRVELSIWLINYSPDVLKGLVQMSMATIVTSGMKNPPKKLEFSQVLPRFWF